MQDVSFLMIGLVKSAALPLEGSLLQKAV